MTHWHPKYTINSTIANALMEIEAARAVVEHTPLPLAVAEKLRRRARIRSTHYSTRIEGNRLTLEEAEQVIVEKSAKFHERERDVGEVRNYWNALLRVEEWTAKSLPLTEDIIKRLHALVEKGARAKPSPYRDGQNVIRDSVSGGIVYLPPEAKDVSEFMAAMVEWVNMAEKDGIPIPIIAALVHYQFVTVHPYYDGNGRTARLLATFILHRGGYGLNGFFSLEEHHARDLDAYYQALVVHPHHNYYEGRDDADLTSWIEYFIELLAGVFAVAKEETLQSASEGIKVDQDDLRYVDPRIRAVMALFTQNKRITSSDVASTLGLSQRMARVLLKQWVEDGWLKVADSSRRARAYILSEDHR